MILDLMCKINMFKVTITMLLIVQSTANDAATTVDAATTDDAAANDDAATWYDDVPWRDDANGGCPDDDAWTGSHLASSVTITTASKVSKYATSTQESSNRRSCTEK